MLLKCLSASSLLFVFAVAAAAGPSADQVLKQADEIRNPSESFFMKVEVKNSSTSDEASVFEVSLKGKDKTLTKTIAPARDRGRNMLMLGEDMWAFVPNLNRAVRVSLNQKLSGQAANGDISRTRWWGDYTAKLESETAKEWQIFLEATKKGLTYDKIRVWVQKPGFQPQRAEYLSLSGKVLKNVSYKAYKKLAGGMRPSEIHIQDAIKPDDVSVIRILNMEVKNFPDSLFNQNNLK